MQTKDFQKDVVENINSKLFNNKYSYSINIENFLYYTISISRLQKIKTA